jgi:myo-inositol-1(or 4)-monophosphatase
MELKADSTARLSGKRFCEHESLRDSFMNSAPEILARIRNALESARLVLSRFTPGAIDAEYKAGHDPVTEADRAVDAVLKKQLLLDGEGWLSEESRDDLSRLRQSRVWVVDPLDGTREFVAGLPEFCVSIAMVEDGRAIAGGISNPATEEIFLGSLATGVTYNGRPVRVSQRRKLEGALVLASRSEVNRGEWKIFENAPFKVQPMGSIAYKLARVSAGLADLTFTLTPKHEWDVAAGAALIESGGGFVRTLEGSRFRSNCENPLLSGLITGATGLREQLLHELENHLQNAISQARRSASCRADE